MTYVFSGEWRRERDRLAAIEAGEDPVTVDVLTRTGIGPGWRCAEVGAGGGSIAEWLANRVGPEGRVFATDLETRFLTTLDAGNLEVRQHDFLVDEAPGDQLDLVHARLVVEHVLDRHAALQRLVTWLRPGGWLVVEDTDWTTRFAVTSASDFEAAVTAALDWGRAKLGYDPAFGRHLPRMLLGLGLTDVHALSHARMLRGATPAIDALKLTLERMAPMTVAAGLLTEDQASAAQARCADPAFATMMPTIISAWGRAPETPNVVVAAAAGSSRCRCS